MCMTLTTVFPGIEHLICQDSVVRLGWFGTDEAEWGPDVKKTTRDINRIGSKKPFPIAVVSQTKRAQVEEESRRFTEDPRRFYFT